MAGFTPFTKNYRDLSDENGYQFEFVCDICGSGYRSEFQRSALGSAGSVLQGASNVLGGLWDSHLSLDGSCVIGHDANPIGSAPAGTSLMVAAALSGRL